MPALVLSGCSGNHLGIPNGDYFAADTDGSPTGQAVYTIKGNSVTTHSNYSHLTDFNPSGKIRKASGELLNYDRFEFSYKTNTVLFGKTTAYVRLKISFDKASGVLTVEGNHFVKGTSGSGQGPVLP